MATITERLASLAMSEDAQRFADNRIDAVSILRDLTEQDLKDIGVPVGHRRKMLRAIAEVGAAPTQMQSAPAPEPKPRDDAERRIPNASPKRSPGSMASWPIHGRWRYFCYPDAHEDDAECAVRAGLALVGRV